MVPKCIMALLRKSVDHTPVRAIRSHETIDTSQKRPSFALMPFSKALVSSEEADLVRLGVRVRLRARVGLRVRLRVGVGLGLGVGLGAG